MANDETIYDIDELSDEQLDAMVAWWEALDERNKILAVVEAVGQDNSYEVHSEYSHAVAHYWNYKREAWFHHLAEQKQQD